jgi:hypothetical protein
MKYLTAQLKNLWQWNTKHKRDKVVGKVIHQPTALAALI